jgi:hypothetical protein
MHRCQSEIDNGFWQITAATANEAERVYGIEHFVNWNDEPQTKHSFWCGTHRGVPMRNRVASRRDSHYNHHARRRPSRRGFLTHND